MKNNKTFNKNNKNQSFNKKIVNNENFSIKIDNYLNKDLKTQNSQNFSITNSMLSPIMNSNLKINKNFYSAPNINSRII
jgi:hypothetical protein